MADLLYCYNKGCGHKFNPEENKEGILAGFDCVDLIFRSRRAFIVCYAQFYTCLLLV